MDQVAPSILEWIQYHGVDDPKAICGLKQMCVLASYPVGKQHPYQRFHPNMVAGTLREFADSIGNPDLPSKWNSSFLISKCSSPWHFKRS